MLVSWQVYTGRNIITVTGGKAYKPFIDERIMMGGMVF